MSDTELKEHQTISRIKTAFIALLGAQSYSQVRMNEVAEKANTSRQNLYRYYRSKEEILRSIMEDVIDDFLGKASPHLKAFDKDFAYAVNYLAYQVVLENKASFDVVMNCGADDLVFSELRRLFVRILGNIIRTQQIEIRDQDHFELVMDLIVGGTYHVLKRWHALGMKQTPDEMAKLHSHFFNAQLVDLIRKPELKN